MDSVMDEVFASIAGETLEVYQANDRLRSRISDKASSYIGTPSKEWPPIYFNWDLTKKGQCLSLDDEKETDFKIYYPEGFILGIVALSNFDEKLCHFSRRNEGELWKVGCTSNLAYLIVYLSENRPISPPVVKPHGIGEVMLQGGHHRYAIAKEIGEIYIPIYIEPKHKKEIDKIIEVNWWN